jgi:hypothetical protein
MKKHAYLVAAVVVITGFLAVSSARAQSNSAPQLSAIIPFEFSIGDRTMEQGEYTLTRLNPSSPVKILQLRRKDGSSSVVIQTIDVVGKIRDNAKLVFNRYGERYFLAQAWMPGDKNGLGIQKSRAERRIEQQLAGMKPKTETVALNVKR